MHRKIDLYLLTSAAIVAFSAPAFAQTATPAPASATPAAADAAPVAGEIIVTAQHRSESVQKIPVAITALSGATLKSEGVKDIFQAASLVPSVVFSRAPDDGLGLTFRGLGTAARPQAFEQSEALFVDGVFMGKARLYTSSFFDIDRLEFIKGTQSTLLGKNASLGAISMVTTQPNDTLSVSGDAGYQFEHGGGYTLNGAVNAPLSDRVDLRVAAHYNDLHGWVYNIADNHWGPEHKDLGIRGSLLFKASSSLKFTLMGQYSDGKQLGGATELIGNYSLPIASGTLTGPVNASNDETPNHDTFHHLTSEVVSLKGELELGTHTLVSQTAYVHYNLYMNDTFDNSTLNELDQTTAEHYNQFTQELRIQSPGSGDLQYMAGVYYFQSEWTSYNAQPWAVNADGSNPILTGAFTAIPGAPPVIPFGPYLVANQLFNGGFINNFYQKQRAESAFASATYKFTPAFRITGGLRFTHETKDVVMGRTTTGPLTVWNFLANPPFAPTPLEHTSNHVDGNASLQYDVVRDVMLFASIGHGSKSGGYTETNTIADAAGLTGAAQAAAVAKDAAIKDETTLSYEAGFKATMLDHTLRFNADVFLMNVTNIQDSVFTGGGFITLNNSAKSYGVEVDTAYQITPQFRIEAAGTYADATGYTLQYAGGAAVPGSGGEYQRPQAPKVTANAAAIYEAPLSNDLVGTFTARVRHRSTMFNQLGDALPSAALTTVDLSAGVDATDHRWGVQFLVKNLFNHQAEDFAYSVVDPRFNVPPTGGDPNGHTALPSPSREIMLSVHFRY